MKNKFEKSKNVLDEKVFKTRDAAHKFAAELRADGRFCRLTTREIGFDQNKRKRILDYIVREYKEATVRRKK